MLSSTATSTSVLLPLWELHLVLTIAVTATFIYENIITFTVILLTLLSPILILLILLLWWELQYLPLPEEGGAETPQRKKKLQFLPTATKWSWEKTWNEWGKTNIEDGHILFSARQQKCGALWLDDSLSSALFVFCHKVVTAGALNIFFIFLMKQWIYV